MPCNIMSATELEPQVSTSTGDVYSMPIALGCAESSDGVCIPATVCVLASTFAADNDYNTTLSLPKRDAKDGPTLRGRCGLYNLGNTCFMNSGIQCLMHTIPLVQYFRDLHLENPRCDATLLGQFKRLFAKIWSGQYTIVHPQDFKQALGTYHPQFQDFRQHDCQEFLALLLDTLHENLNLKKMVTNRSAAVVSGGTKQPIRFEDNINNRLVSLTEKKEKNQVDQSRNAVTSSHSQLTYDNMKEPEKQGARNKQAADSNVGVTRSKESGLFSFTLNQISEDSNHSNVSEHSSDSDQCSVIKNLKLRSSPVVSQSSSCVSHCVSSVQDMRETDLDVSSTFDCDHKGALQEDVGGRLPLLKRAKSLVDVDYNSSITSDKVTTGKFLQKSNSANDLVKCAIKTEMEGADIVICELEADFSNVKHLVPGERVVIGTDDVLSSSGSHGAYMLDSDVRDGQVVLNNAVSAITVPSLEDLCAKESKTLNTNVLATEYMADNVNVDSEKFAKQDNITGQPEGIEEEGILSSVSEAAGKKDNYGPGRVKDVNIRTDKKSRPPKGACSSTFCSDMEDCYVLNSVKRMKFEGMEKNLQIQEMSKISKEKLLDTLMRGSIGDSIPSTSRLTDSDADSFTMEVDADVDMSEEEEEGVDDLEMSPVEPASLASGALYTVAEVLAAEEAWRKYLDRNDSVIVNTFQGQFKSTVVCAECSQVSVTFEPFMYLSVPIPNAMERQICVTYISWRQEPTRYLVMVHKHDRVERVKQELCKLIGQVDASRLVLAEILEWHVSRILEDNTMLRYINDTSRTIYAFNLNEYTAVDVTADQTLSYRSPNAQHIPTSSTHNTQELSMITSSSTTDHNPNETHVFSHMGSFTVSNTKQTTDNEVDSPGFDDSPKSGKMLTDVNSKGNIDLQGTGLWEWTATDGNVNHSGTCSSSGVSGSWPLADSTTPANGALDEAGELQKGDDSVSSSSALRDEWKSCAICLEELPDGDLMVHTVCGGTFCPTCLEMSAQHYRDTNYTCPVCSSPAEMTEDFVPLTSAAQHKPKTRIITMPVSFRCETNVDGLSAPFLFAHPRLISVPSNLSGPYISHVGHQLLPVQSAFRVLLTDGTGLRCSRCLYMERCSGCEIPQDGETILRPGDNLTLAVTMLTRDQLTWCQGVEDHQSMQDQRSTDPTTLQDCFTAFTQSEELDEHNPWFCPHCKKNQRAKKTMTVWQYPDTLIIHLKRFLFHELSSTKVDQKVVFPLDTLDLDHLVSGPHTHSLDYSLYSLVCHFGGSNSGHYTAYGKHPLTGQWYYYNDERVTQQSPGEEEFVSTYVLFYQRKGTEVSLQMADDFDLQVDQSDLSVATGSTPCMLYKPPEGELTYQRTPSSTVATSTQHLSPVTSSHELTSSSGLCDLVGSTSDPEGSMFMENKREAGVQDGEADSTDFTLDFYS